MKTKLKNKSLVISSLLLVLALLFVPFISNLQVKAESVAQPEIVVNGSKLSTATATITCETTGATIYYTIDESDPSSSSTRMTYSSPITGLDEIGEIRAIAIKGDDSSTSTTYVINFDKLTWYEGAVAPIIDILGAIVPILLTLAGTAGAIFIVVLSVNYSKAEDASKREEAKKRLIGSIIGIVSMVALLIVAQLFVSNAAQILYWIRGLGS